MLEAVGLVKNFGSTQVLNGFTLHAAPGEIVGLVGHNGAGKTTIARIVAGLLRPDAGHIRIAGQDPRRARQRIGVAPQHLALYLSATVRENLRLFGGLTGLRGAALSSATDEVAGALHLDGLLDRKVAVLSGGQQRRAQAATALIHRPDLLFLDEPTAGVDPQTREALLAALRSRAEAGAAIVYTTHYLPELLDLGATLAVVSNGRVIARGETSALLADLDGEVRVTTEEGETRVATRNPAATLAQLLTTIQKPVRSVDIRQPSLDDLYRAVAHVR